ncbi:helix-turn-helix domain-containing protein [Halobacillus halophilus]|uniref:helix-turn-helix domain-containing protein n=1 Tax=Halobacillus halophilus TaxID=1570 RepID=UPI001CD47A08|nr:helix-turn-helix domain-containing protein [Halobacillus halophilus]MCA1010534.1 helix-turn-helix domain-containing protein [Halobacillus halophilus]
MKQMAGSLAQIFLGICILAGSWMIADALKESNRAEPAVEQVQVKPQVKDQLMTHLELQEYLGIKQEQLEKILPQKDGNVTKSQIPYIQIGYEYYFPVKAVDQWLEETEAASFDKGT